MAGTQALRRALAELFAGGRASLGEEISALSARVRAVDDPGAPAAFVDEVLARDYDRALKRRTNTIARDALLREPRNIEHGNYAGANGVTATVSGNAHSVNMPAAPYRLRGGIDLNHTHPNASYGAAGDMFPLPLSQPDILALKNAGLRGVLAHETSGGGSYAERTGRFSGYRAERATRAAQQAARKELRGVENPDERTLVEMIPVGRALRRSGALRRYGYRPSTQGQADYLEDRADMLRAAEDAAMHAAWGPINGLPYPFTWGRIGLGAAGLGGGALALREALRERADAP